MRLNLAIIFLIVITLFAFLVRVYKITSSPEGLYIDETSIGYNAYSLVQSGKDEYGRSFPLFFEAFGEYKLPVYIYTVAFAQLFLGPTDLSVRLPSLIFGTLSIPLIYLLAKELFFDFGNVRIQSTVGILSSFLLAFSPWHIQFSRPGFEATVGLFFLIGGLYLFFKSINKNRTLYLALSFFCFVLSLYTYNSARIVVPILVIMLFVLYFRHFRFKHWAAALVIPLMVAIPFLVFSFSDAGLARARQVSVFYQKDADLFNVISDYSKNISPLYLFSRGDPTIDHTTTYRMSLLHPVEAPFFLLSLIFLISRRTKVFGFIIFLFLISLIPPSISTLNPHSLRGFFANSATPIISASGVGFLLMYLKKREIYLTVLALFIISILLSSIKFFDTYHNKYVPNAGWDWQVGIKRVSTRILTLENQYKDIYLDLDMRRAPVLWYLKISPDLYQKSVNKNHLLKYHLNEKNYAEHGLYAGLNPPGGKLIEYVYYPDNSVAYGIWEF